LPGPSRWPTGTGSRPRGSGRRKRWAYAQRTRSRGRLPGRMHRPALARTQRWARRTSARNRRTALKDWLSRHRTPGHRTPRHGTIQAADWNSGLHQRWRRPHRSFVHRSRPGLWNDHARRRRLRSDRTRHNRNSWRSARGDHWRYGRRWTLGHRRRRRGTYGRCNDGRRRNRRRCCRRRRHRSWNNRSRRSSRHGRGRRYHCRLRCRWRGHWPANARRRGRCCRSIGRCRCHGTRRHRWRDRFLLLSNRSQHIPGTGNVRQINFGLDFFFATKRTRTRLAGRRRTFRRGADIHPYLLRFVLFERTGVCLFLRHSDHRQRVENRLTLNFQLSGKIVDSNLTHPAFRYPVL
jgi:hypothetical protein